jgi:VanZ family protein
MGRRAAVICLGAYLLLPAALMLGPTPVAGHYWFHQGTLRVAAALGAAREPTFDDAELLANVLVFVPLAALLVLALPAWSAVRVLLLTAAVSVLVEAAQLLLLPDRDPTARDVLANTTGAAIGVALGAAVRRRSRRSGAVLR